MAEAEHPSLAAAIRLSVSGLIESLHAFLAWNLVAVVAVLVVLAAFALTYAALLLVPFLAPLLCGILRLATVTVRGDHVALRTAVPGIRHRFWTKVGLAAIQWVILLLMTLNVLLAPSIGGILGALSAATSVYLGGSLLAFAIVGWALLCDPRRESLAVRELARRALLVLLRRPMQILFLLLLTGLAALVIYNLAVPGLILPSMVLLAIAGYVLPAADHLAPVTEP